MPAKKSRASKTNASDVGLGSKKMDTSSVELKSKENKLENSEAQLDQSKGKRKAQLSNTVQDTEDGDGKLVDELRTISAKLRGFQQSEVSSESQMLTKLAVRLAEPAILESENIDVRCLSAQCFVDILYLHAPEAPYDDSTLRVVFYKLIICLRGLLNEPDSEAMNAGAYVLQRMAACKMGCVLVDLPDSVPGESVLATHDLATEMFNNVLSSISPTHSLEIERDAVDLLVGYIEECAEEDLPIGVLVALLHRLTPESRKESHRAYDISRAVIMRCSERLRGPVTRLMNGLLVGDYKRLDEMQDAEASGMKSAIFPLFLELFRVDANILLHVLPSIENLLLVDEVELRIKATRLLCDLFLEFTSNSAISEYETLLCALMKRAGDKSVAVRQVVISFAGKCLSSNTVAPALKNIILTRQIDELDKSTLLETIVCDGESSLRSEAVEVCSLVLSYLSEEVNSSGHEDKSAIVQRLSEALADRLHDISVDITIRAMEGLSWAFAKAPKELPWIPNVILGQESKREKSEDYYRVDETRMAMIDLALIGPPQTEASMRIERFFHLYSLLKSERSRSNFARCAFKFRKQVRSAIVSALEYKSKKKVLDPSVEVLDLLRTTSEVWRALWSTNDNKVLDRWRQLVDPLASRSLMIEAKKDVVERIGASLRSQHVSNEVLIQAKELAKSLCRWAGMWTLVSEELTSPEFLDHAFREEKEDLVISFIEVFPSSFGTSDFARSVCAADLNAQWLRIIGSLSAANCLKFPDDKTKQQFRSRIAKTACGKIAVSKQRAKKASEDLDQALQLRKLATRTCIQLFGDSAKDDLDDVLKVQDSWTVEDLVVVLTVARSDLDYEISTRLIDYCTEKVKKPFSANPSSEETAIKELGLKIIIEYLLRVVKSSQGIDQTRPRNLVLMLRLFVSDMGDPWTGQAMRAGKSKSSAWPPNNKPCFARLRLISMTGLMKLECLPQRSPLLVEGDNESAQLKRQARRFIERAQLAFDPEQENREYFRKKITKIDLAQGVQMQRDGAFLAIIASLHCGSTSSNQALADLKHLVKFLAAKSQEYKLSDEKKAILFAPELILPNLVYCLAHNPRFPNAEGELPTYLADHQRELAGPVMLLVDALSATHGKASGRFDTSISFMLTALGTIRTRRDILDDHFGIHCISDLARMVIREYAKYSPSALEPFKARIPLPKIFLESSAGPLSNPRTPSSERESVIPPSPISYLPAGFSLALSGIKKKSKPGKSSASKNVQQNKRQRIERTPVRSQPKRTVRHSRSYAESSESDESDSEDNMSSDEEM